MAKFMFYVELTGEHVVVVEAPTKEAAEAFFESDSGDVIGGMILDQKGATDDVCVSKFTFAKEKAERDPDFVVDNDGNIVEDDE